MAPDHDTWRSEGTRGHYGMATAARWLGHPSRRCAHLSQGPTASQRYPDGMHPIKIGGLLTALLLTGCRARSLPELVIPAGESPTTWKKSIDQFVAQDRNAPAAKNGVVFVGSSSIRLWRTLAEDMAPVPVVHRGFGGSKLFDAIYYSHELVSKHDPSVVVVFSGTNDIAGKAPKSARRVRDLFRQFVARLRWHDPQLAICHIAITPTLAREQHIPIVEETNRLIRIDCESDPLLTFVDPSVDLVDANGRPDPQWFLKDKLHLNKRGYAVWTHHIRPVVQQLYERAEK